MDGTLAILKLLPFRSPRGNLQLLAICMKIAMQNEIVRRPLLCPYLIVRHRTVAVDVGSVNLNVGALFRRRVLEFRAPSPSGTAVIVFDAADFGNFLAHKLVREAVLSRRRFVFDREDVSINASLGIIEFGGRWGGQSVRIALSQAGARKQLVAKVVTSKEDASGLATAEIDTLSRDMSNYFNNLEIDLDGPKLRFVSLSFEGRGVKGGKLKLHLSIVVQKLPSIRAVASF